jgi:hypothetical protein
MNRFKEDEVVQDDQSGAQSAGDGIDRRNFLGCMAWAAQGCCGRWLAACRLRSCWRRQ